MRKLLPATAFPETIQRLAQQIWNNQKGQLQNAAFVGIHTRGVPLANRLIKIFRDQGHSISEGILDINLYRDDLSKTAEVPVLKETKIEFGVNGKVVYLVDDVLYTGRTIRAAMDAIFDLGRPKAVHLVVMAKRNGRELPIDTDFVALNVLTQDSDNIKVKFVETDGMDDVTVLEKGEY